MSVDAVTRQDMYLQYLAGDTAITLPEPVTRIEKYWWDIAKRFESGIGTGGGITVDSALSETSTNPVQNKVVSKRFGEISDKIVNNGGGGLSQNAKSLLITILRNATFETDQTANITALEIALGESGETEQPENGIAQNGSVLAITSGVTAIKTGSMLAIA